MCGRGDAVDRTSESDTKRSYSDANDCGHQRSVQSVLGVASTGLATTSVVGRGVGAEMLAVGSAAPGVGVAVVGVEAAPKPNPNPAEGAE
jgi:hypothetical protein